LDTPENIDPETVKAVLSYFRSHPQAADSVEGVAHWRLLEVTVLHEISETARALRWLTDRGYLIEESVPGASPLYRLDPAHTGAPDLGESSGSKVGSGRRH
jgi:hypothetical protein